MNLKDLNIEQLKALKCDHYENIQRSQQAIQILNAELERRVREQQTNGHVKTNDEAETRA